MDWNWFLFSFNGRINRAKLWLAIPVILSWMIFLGLLALLRSGSPVRYSRANRVPPQFQHLGSSSNC